MIDTRRLGTCDDGIVIDLSGMKGIRVDPAARTAHVVPGQLRSPGGGLPRWIADDEPLVNQDVVVWYTFGITHIPRPEEWPIMPATHVGSSCA